jgi:hypothetical protein
MPHEFFEQMGGSSDALVAFFGPGVIHQNAPHYAGRYGVEMRAILPVDIGADQAKIGFMNQCGCRQCVVAPFGRKALRGQLAELVVDHRHECVKRRLIALAQLPQQHCHRRFGRHHFDPL